jgi:ATP-binding cassette subfamily B protein
VKKLKTIMWSFKLAWRIDKKPMLLWYGLSVLLAVLPAVALQFNQRTLSVISGFLSGGAYTFSDAIGPIIALGALLTVIGLSARVNIDLIYIMMYDTYFVGMYEVLMESIQRVEMTDLLKKDINDNYQYCINYAGSLIDFMSGACAILGKIVSIISLLVVAFAVSKLIFIISLVYVAGVLVLNFGFTEKTRYQLQAVFHEERRIEYYEKLADNRGMAKETRIYENTDEIVRQWSLPFGRVQKTFEKQAFAAELRDFISGAGFYIFLIIVIGVSLTNVAGGTMSPDIFLVLFTLCLNLYTAITGTAGSIIRFDLGLFGLDKQRHVIDLNPPADPAEELLKHNTPENESTVFDVQNLCFSYAPEKPAIKDISFSVNKGEVIALVGQNGSGKTTLIKLLLNMYKPDSGRITFMGRPYADYKRDFLRGKIGVFFQDFYIFHQTLRENVAVGSIEDIGNEERIREAIRKGGAEKLAGNLPRGLDTLLGKFMDKSGTELSGGEKQRVGAARTHMNNRDILIFDEPASMLDPIAEMEQFVNIKNMLGDRTAILISHRVGFARMADRIIMLDGGVIAETGKHDELMAKDGLYAHFFREQAQWYDSSCGSETEKEVAVI